MAAKNKDWMHDESSILPKWGGMMAMNESIGKLMYLSRWSRGI